MSSIVPSTVNGRSEPSADPSLLQPTRRSMHLARTSDGGGTGIEGLMAAFALVLNSERFADLAPAAVFAILLDEGRYHGSVRTMCRLLGSRQACPANFILPSPVKRRSLRNATAHSTNQTLLQHRPVSMQIRLTYCATARSNRTLRPHQSFAIESTKAIALCALTGLKH
jgi:hypothetical protein